MFNNSWFKKEKPLPSLIGLGGGATKIQSQVVAPKPPTSLTTRDPVALKI